MVPSEPVDGGVIDSNQPHNALMPITNSPFRSPLRSPRTNVGGGASVSARVAQREAMTAAAGIEMPTIQSSLSIPPNGRVFTTCGIDFVSRANADTHRKRVVAEYVENQRQLKLSAVFKATTVVDVTEIRQQFEKRNNNSSSSIRTSTTATATKMPRTHTSPPPLSRGSPRSLWSPIPSSTSLSSGDRKKNVVNTPAAASASLLSSPTLMASQRPDSPSCLAPELRAEACDDLDLKQQHPQQQQQQPTSTPLLPNSPAPVAVSELWVRLREREIATDELSLKLKEALELIESLREQVAILMATKDQSSTVLISTIPVTPMRQRPSSVERSDFSPPPPPPPPQPPAFMSAIATVGM